MKKLFKFIAYLIGVVVVLVVAAAVAVPVFFDPNDYRDEVVAKIKSETGRDLQIDGEIGLTLFPWIGAEVGTVELGNAPGFPDPFFARVERVNIRVKLMPLLSRQVEMDTITIHGLALNLARDAEGKTNWDDLATRGTSGQTSQPGAGEGAGVELAGLAIGGLDLKNASLKWTDAQSGQSLSVDQLDIETDAVTPGKPVEVKLEAKLSGDALSGGTAEVSLAGNVEVDPAAGSFAVDGLKLEAKLTGDALPGGKAEVSLAGNVMVDPATGSFAIEDLELGAMDLEATGRVALSGEQVSGSLSVAEFDLRKMLSALGQAAPVTADPDVLSKVALSADFSGTMSAIDVKPLSVTLDDSKLEGGVSVAKLGAPMPALGFALSLDAIDADRYLPPPAEGEAPQAPTPGAAVARGADLPMDTLRALDVDGSLNVGELKVAGLTTSEVVVTVKAKDGLIALSPLAARLYEGTYAGDVRLDAREDVPLISADEKLTRLQVGPLLQALTGEERLSGTTDVSAKVTARGVDPDAIKQSLNGDAAFAFTEGALNGINIARTIREFKAKLEGRTLPPAEDVLKTDFSSITGTFQIANGVIDNQDLEAVSPLLRIVGRGVIDLGADQLDYRPTVTVVATTKGEGGKDLEDLVGVPIPLRVHGPLAAPEYGVDFDAAVAVVAKSKAQDLIKDQLGASGISTDKLGGALPGGLGAALPGLMGGGGGDAAEGDASTSSEPATEQAKPEGTDKSVGEAVKGLKGLFGN